MNREEVRQVVIETLAELFSKEIKAKEYPVAVAVTPVTEEVLIPAKAEEVSTLEDIGADDLDKIVFYYGDAFFRDYVTKGNVIKKALARAEGDKLFVFSVFCPVCVGRGLDPVASFLGGDFAAGGVCNFCQGAGTFPVEE